MVDMLQTRLGVEPFFQARNEAKLLPADTIAAEALALPASEAASPSLLSARELNVLRLLATGLRDKEIAETLYISVRTVEGHVARILTKLGVASRVVAVNAATARGLADIDRCPIAVLRPWTLSGRCERRSADSAYPRYAHGYDGGSGRSARVS